MKNRVTLITAELLVLSIIGALVGTHASAQTESTTISGVVLNGTDGFTSVIGAELSLHVFQDNMLIDTSVASVDLHGKFVFDGYASSNGGELRYILTAMYKDVPYSVELTHAPDLVDVQLPVYEPTGATDDLSLSNSSIFVMRVDPRKRLVFVYEMATVSNGGDQAFQPGIAASGTMSLLRFPLPQGATNLEVESELLDGKILQIDRGFALDASIPPGEYGIAFTYLIPYEGTDLDLSRRFWAGAGILTIFVADTVAILEARDLHNVGSRNIGSTTYNIFSTMNVLKEQRIEMTLTKLPQPSFFEQIRESIGLGSVSLVVTATLTISLTTLLFLGLFRGLSRRKVPSVLNAPSLSSTRLSFVREIAALDDRFQRGEIDADSYQSQRQQLKSSALRLAWREERQ